ncbi:transcription termination factor MTERF6, chloroplastic/mitochondrial-like [Prunus dulcis]|uniref:transcription termination factor MTERF6, chloroplastic/mitochondrial-like n=1 Tax=Prunus dulcis TaxID=3755 RepID=UPI0014831ECA|nr:transcription termination factor MTERF6, chloroplastic/mitochondrial-like [Prunus dulcis]
MVVPLYSLNTLRLGSSIISCTFASTAKRFLVGDLKPSHISLQNHLLHRSITSKISADQHNFTVAYLINSCGLSPEGAILSSKWVELQSSQGADSVLALLSKYGLSETQISKVVRSRPTILVADPEKILSPKLEFFSSVVVSREDLARILCFNPHLLLRSLENQIIPTYNFLRSLISEENVVSVLKRSSWIFRENRRKNVVPNIELLRELGMPQSCIALLVAHNTEVLIHKHEKFAAAVEEVKAMEFDMKKSTFVLALRALCGESSKSIWNRSREIYKRSWGWSDNDVVSAFRKNPQCMTMSEKKIMEVMDFFVNKMGYSSGVIATYPLVLCFSLEKRIIPRCSVVKVLLLKGLIDEDFSLSSVLLPPPHKFLERFVTRYINQLPILWDVYHLKLDVKDV